jgi:hypothetical protein
LLTPFAQALFDGLRGHGVRDSQGYISIFGLHEYVYDTVSDVVQQAYNTQQEPQLFLLRGTEPFAVALYRGATSFGDDLEDELPPHAGVHELDLNHTPPVRDAAPVLRNAAGNGQRQVLPAEVMADADAITGSVSADDPSVVAGDAPSGTYHQATAPEHQHLVDVLKELRRAIQTSDLPDERKDDAFAGLAEVDAQMTRAQPDLALMQNMLNEVRQIVADAGPTAEMAQTLAQQALAAARREYQ